MHVLHTFDVIVLKFRILHLNQSQMALNGECHNFNLDQWLCSLGLWGSIKKEEPAGPIIVVLAAGECVVSCSCNFCCYMGWVGDVCWGSIHRWHLWDRDQCLFMAGLYVQYIWYALCFVDLHLSLLLSSICRRLINLRWRCVRCQEFPNLFQESLFTRHSAFAQRWIVLAWPARMFRVPNIFSMGRHGEGHGMG